LDLENENPKGKSGVAGKEWGVWQRSVDRERFETGTGRKKGRGVPKIFPDLAMDKSRKGGRNLGAFIGMSPGGLAKNAFEESGKRSNEIHRRSKKGLLWSAGNAGANVSHGANKKKTSSAGHSRDNGKDMT